LCASRSLQRGTLSLPSLTHFMLKIIPYNDKEGWGQLIATALRQYDSLRHPRGDPKELRPQHSAAIGPYATTLAIQNFQFRGLNAFLVTQIKQINKLVILDSKIDGSAVNSYYEPLRSDHEDHTGTARPYHFSSLIARTSSRTSSNIFPPWMICSFPFCPVLFPVLSI
jgi:hypothetical protein